MVKVNKAIIVLEGADCDELKEFAEYFNNEDNKEIFVNQKCQVYEVKNNKLYKVVSSLEEVEGISFKQ